MSVEVTLDQVGTKEVPIQIDWVGRLPEGLILTGARLPPHNIELIGGTQILEGISTVYTEPVAIDGIQKSGTMAVKLALKPGSLRLAPGSKDVVTVEYEVTQRVQ